LFDCNVPTKCQRISRGRAVAFSAISYYQGSSFLRQHLDVQVFDRAINLRDDATDPAQVTRVTVYLVTLVHNRGETDELQQTLDVYLRNAS